MHDESLQSNSHLVELLEEQIDPRGSVMDKKGRTARKPGKKKVLPGGNQEAPSTVVPAADGAATTGPLEKSKSKKDIKVSGRSTKREIRGKINANLAQVSKEDSKYDMAVYQNIVRELGAIRNRVDKVHWEWIPSSH